MLRSATTTAALALMLGCELRLDADSGSDALMHVDGGVFRRAALPPANGGPSVLSAYLGRSQLRLGEQDKSFSGSLEAGASAVALTLEGDIGFWTVPAGFPLPEAPASPSFSAPISFSSKIALGPSRIWTAAVGEDGRYGPWHASEFEFVRAPLPEGELTVALVWDVPSDLDLHVVTPSGTEIDKTNTSSRTPGGSTGPWGDGELAFDSNADCLIDGRNTEHVSWQSAPAPGHYVVRVDTFSLCEQRVARWNAEVWLRGVRLASAEGTSTGASTRQTHERGAGVLAIEFDVP